MHADLHLPEAITDATTAKPIDRETRDGRDYPS